MQRPVQIIADASRHRPGIIRVRPGVSGNFAHQLCIDAFIQSKIIVGKQFLLCVIQAERAQSLLMRPVRHDIQMIVVNHRSFFKKQQKFLPRTASVCRKINKPA